MTASKRWAAPPTGPPRSSLEEDAIVVEIVGPIARADIERLCERIAALLDRGRPGTLICDVRGLGVPDGESIDALARLQVLGRRSGRTFLLRNASTELLDLLILTGLSDVIGLED